MLKIFKVMSLILLISAIWAFCTIYSNQHITMQRTDKFADLASDSSLKPTQEFKVGPGIMQKKNGSIPNPKDSSRLTDGDITSDVNRDTTKEETKSLSVTSEPTNQLDLSSDEFEKDPYPMKTSGLLHGDMQKELSPRRKEKPSETKTVFTPQHIDIEEAAKDNKDIVSEQFRTELPLHQSSEYSLSNTELQAAQRRLTQAIMKLEDVTSEFWR